MQNEFEKQVQQKMEELDFVPTPPVWQKIEAQIRRKKDRRRLLFWLPLAALLLGGGVWWAMENGGPAHQKAITGTAPVTTPIPSPGDNDNDENDNKQSAPTTHPSEKNDLDDQALTTTAPNSPRSGTRSSNTSSSYYSTTASPVKKKVPARESERKDVLTKTNTITASNEAATDITIQQPGARKKIGNAEGPDSSVAQAPVLTVPPSVPPVMEKKEAVPAHPTPDKTDSAVVSETTLIKTPARKKFWQLALTAGIGSSGLGTGINLFGSAEKAMPLASSGPPPVASPGPVSRADSSSSGRNGWSFAAGAAFTRQIGKRTILSVGLGYNYYSTFIDVGYRVQQDTVLAGNTFVNQFYTRPGMGSGRYRNNYHFVSLPIGIDWQLLKKAPLQLHAGLALQQLIATNGLQYNPGSRVYYNDKKAFNHTLVFSDFGLTYAVPVGQWSLAAGPQVQYGISKLEKENDQRHLFSFGIRAQLQRQKK